MPSTADCIIATRQTWSSYEDWKKSQGVQQAYQELAFYRAAVSKPNVSLADGRKEYWCAG